MGNEQSSAPQKNSRGVREIRHIEDGRELLRFVTIMQVTFIISPELPSWLQVNYKILEGWSRQEVESKEFLRRILNQAVLSTDKNCTQKKKNPQPPPTKTVLSCSAFEARVQEKMRALCPGEGVLLVEVMQSITTPGSGQVSVLPSRPASWVCAVPPLAVSSHCFSESGVQATNTRSAANLISNLKNSSSNSRGIAGRSTELPNYYILF